MASTQEPGHTAQVVVGVDMDKIHVEEQCIAMDSGNTPFEAAVRREVEAAAEVGVQARSSWKKLEPSERAI